MTALELSCGLPPGPDFAGLAALAEELGYARVWIFDSAPLWEDPLVHLALAAERTRRIGLATAVLIPDQRSPMAMASGIATIARISGGRFRACFGTGFTSRFALGRRPMPLDDLARYVRAVRGLLAGETVRLDGAAARMLHADGLAAARPVGVPLWLSAFGPRGTALAEEIADGVIGPPHPALPSAVLASGTVLDPGEEPDSARVREAVGPWRVVDWHNAYAASGADAVDALPGGLAWRESLEKLAPEGERHLLTFEGHVTHLTERDRPLLDHIGLKGLIGGPERVARRLGRLADAGYREVIYTPTGPDVPRELRALAAARP
ncbi:LLM class flavin-dependent oxidoreductase [Actinomadura sp. LD22]|uniref:LLM class flavin-dependent oxidoreductase n=1 Tax=Actinomadura physcomitrii TaxID=2650748 RepID=A0A6I4MSY5_9ACTN|nr:LLM class flavin-dependent oxidoreductase [Actinomadura physcomitrii]MWA07084.1 LLM class flavin-dependent oxidoreductase [Actinomadura physcomitrii]